MVLSRAEMGVARSKDQWGIEPFDPKYLQPASYDVRLSGEFRRLSPQGTDITAFGEATQQWLRTPVDPFYEDTYPTETPFRATTHTLQPGDFLLGCTFERVTLGPSIVGRVEGKSSLARLGLIVHTTAGYIDPGFSGNITLELVNLAPWPIVLTAGMPIAQLALARVHGFAHQRYGGKYQGVLSQGPVASRYYMNEHPHHPREATGTDSR